MKTNHTAACTCQVTPYVVLTSTVVLFDENQDTSRYLNRHLQDFSVVLTEVRGKIPQVRPSHLLVNFGILRYQSLHLEPTNASRRMFTVVSPCRILWGHFVRGQIPSLALLSLACWQFLCLCRRNRWRVRWAAPWERCCVRTRMFAMLCLWWRLAFASLARRAAILRVNCCPTSVIRCRWTHKFPALSPR